MFGAMCFNVEFSQAFKAQCLLYVPSRVTFRNCDLPTQCMIGVAPCST